MAYSTLYPRNRNDVKGNNQMSKTIKPDELSQAILDELENFKDVTEEAAWEGVVETSNDALQQLRNAHPSGSGKYRSWDKYNRGWTVKKTKRDKTVQIHNATDYQLTHLLEKGHALRDGGRSQAFVHIAPVADKCDTELLNNIKKHI